MDYVISSDPSWVEVDVVWRFLSEESYWARGVPRESVLKSLANSISFGVYEIGPRSRREQVGFARVVSDRATFAYLADVFVLTEHRGQGLSKRLLEAVLAHPDLLGLRRWLLFTAYSHTLYAPFALVPTTQPDRLM